VAGGRKGLRDIAGAWGGPGDPTCQPSTVVGEAQVRMLSAPVPGWGLEVVLTVDPHSQPRLAAPGVEGSAHTFPARG